MGTRKLSYSKALIIVHGKSEYQLCKYLKQNLRIPLDICGDKNGEKSIQITSVMNTLHDKNHRTFTSFYDKYPTINVEGKGNKRTIKDFKIFIIMDLDDCSPEQAAAFKDKTMFRGHWAYDYIVPIYNNRNLEDVLIECGIPFSKKKGKEQYMEIFPTDKKYIKSDSIQVKEFAEKLRKCNNSNLLHFIEYLLQAL